MEGCLYRKCDNKYYLINTIATYNYIAVEFESFISCFIQNENFDIKYELVHFNPYNVKMLLDNYEEFQEFIDYSNLDDFNTITYNQKIYIIKNWKDVFNFVAGRI
jgi:hypothetical protein